MTSNREMKQCVGSLVGDTKVSKSVVGSGVCSKMRVNSVLEGKFDVRNITLMWYKFFEHKFHTNKAKYRKHNHI